MPTKRKNGGRNKKNKGRALTVHCLNCQRLVGKDKAIKRFIIKNMTDGSSKRDIEEASVYNEENYQMPKLFLKNNYCIACGIHARIVRVRSGEDRRIRYISKYRGDKKEELTKLYRVANQKFVEQNNPFKAPAEEDEKDV
jgi:small subunit ribosomal protein S26e